MNKEKVYWAILIVAAVAFSGFLYWSNNEFNKQVNDTNQSVSEIKTLINTDKTK